MWIRFGYDIKFKFSVPTPMVLLLSPHPSVDFRMVQPASMVTSPIVPLRFYYDTFGNTSGRLTAPEGEFQLYYDGMVYDSGLADIVNVQAEQWPVQQLPDEVLPFLMDSRYCEVELLADAAWRMFADTPPGWARVQAICDWVFNHIEFGYHHARNTRTAFEAFKEGQGVCRDFNHLAVAFCRAMHIPARYCNGYLGEIGVPPDPSPMDFSAWFEAYLGGEWYTFDARNNVPRIGRILVSRGRDAKDTAMATSFGQPELTRFNVWTDEIKQGSPV
jgi:transglutaminase-like putative cysteine protease